MKIDLFNDNKITIENVGKVENILTNAAESVKQTGFENKSVTMVSTDINKSNMLTALTSDGTFEEIKDNAQMLKNNLSIIKKQMEAGNVVSMDEAGIDINNTEVEKIVTVAERIRIKLAMCCDDYSVMGMDVDAQDIKATMGYAGYKAASELSDAKKAYLVKNELEPTAENVYKAMHSGAEVLNTSPITDEQWEEIKPQALAVIKESGLDAKEDIINRVRYMVENGIEITPVNVAYFNELDNLKVPSDEEIFERIRATVIEGRRPEETLVNGKKLPFEETVEALNTVKNATDNDIKVFATREIKTLEVLAEIEKAPKMSEVKEDSNYFSTYRQLQEIRLMMTIEAGRTLEKNGFSINTTEISELIEQLKKYEAGQMLSLNDETGDVNPEEIDTVNETMLAFKNLQTAPAYILSFATDETEISPQTLIGYSADYVRKAGFAYEALSTKVRADLGDTINKAIKASTEDILAGLGYKNTEENQRAVRILSYNRMEMTEQNIDKIKDLDLSINTLFRKMTPERTLTMIRENINPLTIDVRELTDIINEMPQEMAVEKYSEYLYEIEKKQGITPEEREKYIAVYSLINKFEKDGMNALGSLYKQGLDFTMGNLVTAYMTRKSGGIDVTAKQDTGLSEIKDKVSYYRHLFSGIREKITPDRIDGMEKPFECSIEEFVSEIKEAEPSANTQNTLAEAVEVSDDVIKFIAEYELPQTPAMIAGVERFLKNPSEAFKNRKNKEFPVEKQALMDEYKELSENAEQALGEAVSNTEKYLDFNALKQINTGIRIAGALAKKNNFFIPYNNAGKDIVINLKVVEQAPEKGKIQVSFHSEKYGEISAEGKITENEIMVHIISDSREGTDLVDRQLSQLETELKKYGYEKITINTNTSEELPSIHASGKDNVNTEKLFDTAKIFIDFLTN